MRTISGPSATPLLLTVAAATVSLAVLAVGIEETCAQGGTSGIVRKRIKAMATMGDHAEVVGDMLRGKRAFDGAAVLAAAASFVEHGRRIPELFPDTAASRLGAKTEALPTIWENWEVFSGIASRFVDDGRTLAAAAEAFDGDGAPSALDARTVKAVFLRATENCSRCHERFRLETD